MVFAEMSKGRGGIENRHEHEPSPNVRWAVDVARAGHSREATRAGLIWAFYVNRADAERRAAGWNAQPGLHAIVVPAWYQDAATSPWETPEGRDEMDAAYLAAGVPRPDWLQELFDRDGDIGANRQDPGGEPVGRDPAAEPVALTAETDTADPEPVEEDSIDPQDALIMLRDMVAAISQEGRTVEPLVVLLWALGRARAFQPQLTRYGDVVGELSELLLAWAPESDPVQVWLDLAAAWPQWWQIVMPTSAEASEAPNLQGGLSNSIYELAALDTSWNLQAEQVLRDAIGPGPELSDLLVTVGLAAPPQAAAPVGAQPYKVPVEQNIVEEYTVEYDAMASTTRLRREAMLQNRYVEHLRAQGHAVCGYRIPIDGQYFRADLYDGTTDELIEVKSSVDRVTMRLALGQILDYARVLRPTLCTVLVPERPADGLIDLFGDHEVRLVWPTEAGEFVS